MTVSPQATLAEALREARAGSRLHQILILIRILILVLIRILILILIRIHILILVLVHRREEQRERGATRHRHDAHAPGGVLQQAYDHRAVARA